MMNTMSWEEHIAKLRDRYQLIIYDMRDQGQSSRLKEGYDVAIHADDLKRLLVHLNVERTNLFGLSYGGQVAMIFALKYPEMVDRLILSNTLAHVDQFLLSLGQMWITAAKLHDGEAFFDLALIPIYSPAFYNSHFEWLMNRRKLFKELLTREWFEGFIRLASSNRDLDIRNEISRIKSETLLIAAQEDVITPFPKMLEMSKRIDNAHIVCIPEAGHGAILEKVGTMCMLIRGFLG
jgi:pimeloyl-ACP methyl ester carboxylesterase